MHTLKKILRGLSSQTLKLALFLAAISAATVAILGTPEPAKQVLHDSGIYDKFALSTLEKAKQEQAEQQTNQPGQSGNLDINDPEIQKIVQNALPPEFLEKTANNALDGLFAWLNGETPKPQIIIDLSEPKQRLATNLGQRAYDIAVTKPACTRAQLATIDPNNIDFFELPCIPPGLDLRAEQAKLTNKIATGNEIIKETTFNLAEQKGEDGKPAVDFAKFDWVPLAFKIFSMGAIIWGVIAIVSGGILALLHDERRRGIWVIGHALVTNGVILLVFAVLANYLSSQVRVAGGNQNDLTQLVPRIAQDIIGQFTKVIFLFAGAYIVIGAATMLASRTKKSGTTPAAPAQKSAAKPPKR